MSKYIRPMSFFQTVGTMYRLYLKIMVPIFLLNTVLVLMSWWVLAVGAFVGPVLIMTSNAILGKPSKVLDSLWKGIFSMAFLKVALSSIGYILLILSVFLIFVATGIFGDALDFRIGPPILVYAYIILLPLWVFVPMTMLLEKKGLRASVRRSLQILRKNFLRILQMDVFIIVVITIMSYLISLLFGIGEGDDFSLGAILSLFLFLFTGFSSYPYVFVYYEYRARYENYSEELLTQEMGYQPVEEMMTV